ncbi:ABC transporter ATP-binding protein [Calderihabitans maritimus]|uniref:Phosphonate-transporting ATPase n=1 Tax=Calderihabitans maritimus TaxID=1246530 RepID=A0A1Z5HSW2_9FIRM|nr:phosphonate-transporting ATPase [Calderihabitans maritimus]
MPLLKLQEITRQYKSGQIRVNALKGISLTVEEGEFVSIMGPSGSGKSTLLNIIGCLDRPTSGTYELAGQRIENLSDSRLADIRNRFIGFVFQSFHLIPDLDAQANVELPLIYRGMGARERRFRAVQALEAVGLAERRHHRPSQLSGGEQQRVAIARALVGDPKVILADEPTGALDSRSGRNIMAIFQQLNRERGITIVQVTHEKDIACYGRRIVYLLDGQVEREEILEDPQVAFGEAAVSTTGLLTEVQEK